MLLLLVFIMKKWYQHTKNLKTLKKNIRQEDAETKLKLLYSVIELIIWQIFS